MCKIRLSIAVFGLSILLLASNLLGSPSLAAQVAQSAPRDLQNDLVSLSARIQNLNGSADEIATELNGIYRRIYLISPVDFNRQIDARTAQVLIREIFQMRLALRNQIPRFMAENKATPAVINSIRNLFRVARYAEDMIGEMAAQQVPGGLTASAGMFTGGDLAVLWNPSMQNQLSLNSLGQPEFRSGDVIMVRGDRFNSAAIARISDVWSQFSHLIQVYVDENGQAWGVEALIEDGLVVHKIEDILKENVGRAVLFRYKDLGHPENSAAVAHAAAQVVYQRAVQSAQSHKVIDYDFSMRLDSYDKLFCSKVVRNAYDIGSDHRVVLPQFPSSMKAQNRDFFDRIGVQVTETFAPGDMEVDPHFEMLGEWRDLQKTSEMRIKDMILSKIFLWMERYGIVFDEPLWVTMAASSAKMGSYTPLVRDLISKAIGKIPTYMSRSTISTMIMLQFTADPLLKKLQKASDDYQMANRVPMHPREILHELDQIFLSSPGYRVGFLSAPKHRAIEGALGFIGDESSLLVDQKCAALFQ
jgi:hypothetical protein